MSGSIGRSYLIQSWNDAGSYSGEQIGQRLKQSTDLYLANGKANTDLFAEALPEKKKQRHIRDKICPQNTTLNNLDLREEELDAAFLAEEIDSVEWMELSRVVGKKRIAAHKSLMKSLGITEDTAGTVEAFQPLEPPINDVKPEPVQSQGTTTERPLTACNGAACTSFDSFLKLLSKIIQKDWFIFLTGSGLAAILLLIVSN